MQGLKTQSFENLTWVVDESLMKYQTSQLPGNNILDMIKKIDKLPFLDIEINFSDITWDFSSVTNLPVNKPVFHFKLVPICFRDIVKFFVLTSIFNKESKLQTILSIFQNFSGFLRHFNENGYTDLRYLNKDICIKHLSLLDVQYNTKVVYKRSLVRLLNFYEINFSKLHNNTLINSLEEINLSKFNDNKEANKHQDIPENYYNQLLHLCISIMDNLDETNYNRCMAAVIIMYSQVGFRTGEFLTVEANSIKEDYSPDNNKKLIYLNYLSYKGDSMDGNATIAHTIINELSHRAYLILEELCKPYRENLNTNLLFVTQFQKVPLVSSGTMSNRFIKFLFRNNDKLDCINVEDKYPELHTYNVGTIIKQNEINRKLYCNNLKDSDTFVAPVIHQFRVNVCTSLYRQGVPIEYIRRHMNHLSDDITDYYIRPKKEKELEKEYSEAMFTAILTDEAKLLGKDGSTFVENINSFIDKNNYNIKKDTETIIKEVSNNFPIRVKVGGLCINSGDIIPCAFNDSTDELYRAYGMCENNCHMYFMADITYDNYSRLKQVIQYNLDNGFERAAEKETNKIKYIVETSLFPELEELKFEIEKYSKSMLKEKHPNMTFLIDNFDTIYEEVIMWKTK